MNKVLIMTDSTADLSKEVLLKNDIESIPLFIRFDEEVYLDGVEIEPKELYQKVQEKKVMAKSSGLRSGDFNIAFRKFLARGYDIIYIGISSKLSGSVQSAEIAKNSIDKDRIHIIDSLNLSGGLAFLVLKAVELRNEGKSAVDIKQAIEKMVPNVRSYYIIPSLDYLFIGGKITSVQRFLGKILSTKPMITVNEGEVSVHAKPYGSIEKVISHMLKIVFHKHHQVDKRFFVLSESYQEKGMLYLRNTLKNTYHIETYHRSYMGCVIAAHAGKGAIGLTFIERD